MTQPASTIPAAMARRIWQQLSPQARASLGEPESLRDILADAPSARPRKSEQLTIRIRAEDKAILAAESAARHMSQSDYIVMLLHRHIADQSDPGSGS